MSRPQPKNAGLFASGWNYSDLKTRILVPVMFMLTVMYVLTGYSFYQSEQHRLQQELDLRGQIMTMALSSYASHAMTAESKTDLEQYIQNYIQDKNLLYQLSIYQQDQVYITVTSGTLRQKLLPETLRHYSTLIYSRDDNSEIGRIEAALSTQGMDDALNWLMIRLMVIGAVLIILLTSLLSLLLDHTVIRPLERLANKIQTISMGHINDKVVSMSWDEIGHLFRDINAMRVRFKSRETAFIDSLMHMRQQRKEDIDVSNSKALVVDDDPTIQAIARKLLENNKIQVEVAGDGKQAMSALSREKFDIILLDLMMPEMSGFEVLQQLKDRPEYNSIPVIVVSSITDKESIVKALANGATDFVIKPFNHNELQARINVHLSRYLSDKAMENAIRNEMENLKH